MRKVFYILVLLLLSLGAGWTGQSLHRIYIHIEQDHQFIHWLAVEIEKQQKLTPKP